MRMRQALEPEHLVNGVSKLLIYTLGVSGQTSQGAIKRFSAEIGARYSPHKKTTIIFAVGGNDAAFVPSTQAFRVDAELYIETMARLIVEAKAYGSVVIQGLTPVIESVTEYQAGRDRSKTNRYVERYDSSLRQLCVQSEIPHVDAYSGFIERGLQNLLCTDGVHPNADGHRLLSELMLATLRENP